MEGLFRFFVPACDVTRQRDHRTGIIDFFQVLPGQVSANDLRAGVCGLPVDMDTFPAVIPFRVGEEALHHLRVQIALAGKVLVKPTMGKACIRHNLLD